MKILYYFIIVLFRIGGNCKTTSEKKCNQYDKIIRRNRDCGIMRKQVHNNNFAALKEFPHMAIIGFGQTLLQENLKWFCGGSLISENFILSAAHCLKHNEFGLSQRVKIGMINILHPNKEMQEHKILKRFIHPKFAANTMYNDISLIKLELSVVFSPFVRPACLGNVKATVLWNELIAIGYGYIHYDSERGSNNLMKVNLGYIDNKTCQKVYSNDLSMINGVIDGQFCAGYMDGMKDTCQGDSGGPLQLIDSEFFCMYKIVGIISFGKFCGFANSPGIYTNVSKYIKWIENIVWK